MPITTTHDENGYAHVILSMDEAREILHALETAVKVAPTEGGTPIAVAAASVADFYRWAGLFASALGAINAGIAGCLDTPDKRPTLTQEEPNEEEPAPGDTLGILRSLVRQCGYDSLAQEAQSLTADGTITPEVGTALGQIVARLQREEVVASMTPAT